MAIEQESKPYQNRHHKRVSLDGYRGVAESAMELNYPIADGFMRVADMRSDIVIIQKPHDRVTDYDQVGNVRVAKFLQLPRLGGWRGDKITQTRKESDTWLIAIDDQELSQNVARTNNGTPFNQAFTEEFSKEVTRGMKTVLKREKLLNGGEYNLAFMVSYFSAIGYDSLLLPLLEYYMLESDGDLSRRIQKTALIGASSAGVHMVWNVFNMFGVLYGKVTERVFGLKETREKYGIIKYPEFNDPFIKHSVPELVMPTVPVDRLARGMKYLADHGHELVKNQEYKV